MDRGYLTLAQAGEYAGGHSSRWARRHLLKNVPHVDLPGSGAALFKPSDIDTYLKRFRREPVNVDSVVDQIMGPVGGKRGTR
jgi:hypothetical protein